MNYSVTLTGVRPSFSCRHAKVLVFDIARLTVIFGCLGMAVINN